MEAVEGRDIMSVIDRQLTGAEYCEQAAWHFREAAKYNRLGKRSESVRHGHLGTLHLRRAVEHVLGMLRSADQQERF